MLGLLGVIDNVFVCSGCHNGLQSKAESARRGQNKTYLTMVRIQWGDVQ
jgi:hypothetical protein